METKRFEIVPPGKQVLILPVFIAVFDMLALNGESTMTLTYSERRKLLESLDLDGFWFVPPVFVEGAALFAAVCENGLEGVVAKRRDSPYRPGERGWIKVKNRQHPAMYRVMDALA